MKQNLNILNKKQKMEIYRKNILDSNEDDETHMLSFTNTVSIEALTTGEKILINFQ